MPFVCVLQRVGAVCKLVQEYLKRGDLCLEDAEKQLQYLGVQPTHAYLDVLHTPAGHLLDHLESGDVRLILKTDSSLFLELLDQLEDHVDEFTSQQFFRVIIIAQLIYSKLSATNRTASCNFMLKIMCWLHFIIPTSHIKK